MRFTEIASPEDQLALWRLVSDKMWAAFAQPVPQGANTQAPQSLIPQSKVASPAKSFTRPMPKGSYKASPKAKPKSAKPKLAPMAAAPKPLPKPKPLPLTPTQAAKHQTQQHQALAQHLHKELIKSQAHQKIPPQPPTPTKQLTGPTVPMTNGFDERDKDELVMHSRAQHPFKTVSQIKTALSGRNRGI